VNFRIDFGQQTKGGTLKKLLALVFALLLSACASEPQSGANSIGEVHIRKGGDSHSSAALDQAKAAALTAAVLPFARLASRAYCQDYDPETSQPDECKKTSSLSEEDGWVYLFDSKAGLPLVDQSTRLSFLVFYRVNSTEPTKGDIVFAFRGTKPKYLSDWYANAHWLTRFLPFDDQYDILYRAEPDLIIKAKQLAKQKQPSVQNFAVFSTGHSLGAGLAQLFAFGDRSVEAAITFDPSPVTGFKVTVKDDRVNCSTKVLRIYERGEILQYLRSAMRKLYTPTPNVTEIDFKVFTGRTPIDDHSIKTLTDSMARALTEQQARDKLAPLDRTQRRLALDEWLPTGTDENCTNDRKVVGVN
jgi:hypothetical protein